MKSRLALLPLAFALLAAFGACGKTPAGAKKLGAIWCVGDSLTQGNADADANSSPRKELVDQLTARGFEFTLTGHHTANPDGIAETGKTPDTEIHRYHSGVSGSVIGDDFQNRANMTSRLDDFWTKGRLATVKPDIILVMIGSNDTSCDHEMPGAPARLEKFLRAIFAKAAPAKPALFLATIPPNHCNNAAERAVAYNAAFPGIVAKLKADGLDVSLVDTFTPMNAAYDKTMRDDGLHPNAAGNTVIAKCWADAIAAHSAGK